MLCTLLAAWAFAAPDLSVSAKSAVILDETTGKVIWARDADTPRFPASTTKILTAMLLIERCLPDEVVVAPKDIEKVGGASLHLKPGEKVSVGQILYAILLRSANDACVAAAIHVSGSVAEFSKLMNQRAKELGCTNSHFNNPNGLNDELHTTSARDLAIIARAAMKYDVFRDIVGSRKHTIVRSMNSKDSLMVSKNKYLDFDPSADGIKTGWTVPAGQCFVGSATRDGHRLITVILKSESWTTDNKTLLDWGFSQYDRLTLVEAGHALGAAHVDGGDALSVAAVTAEPVLTMMPKGTQPQMAATFIPEGKLVAPIKAGTRIGRAIVTDGDGLSVTVPLVAAADVGRERGAARWSIFLVASGIGTGAYWMRSQKKRRRRAKRRMARA